MKRWMVAALGMGAVVGLTSAAPGQQAKRGLEIFFVDVEGGAATLTVTPAGESVLVDCGWPGRGGRDAKRIVHVLKEVAGLQQLDHYVTTHWHTDHYGGIADLAKLVPIRNYWDRGIPATGDGNDFADLIHAYKIASGGKSKTLKAGDVLPLRPEGLPIKLDIVAASGKVTGEGAAEIAVSCGKHPAKPVDPSDNAKSLALLLHYGQFDFLNCGDLTWNIEHKLVCPSNRVGKVDLWQVTHHGSDQSNNPAVPETIEPVCAVMCNGPRKGGSPGVVQTIKRTPSIQGFFALHRNVASTPQDNAAPEFTANMEEQCQGEFLRVRLNEAGDEYTVQKGTGPVLKSFKVK
jgi:competence protein ComEC